MEEKVVIDKSVEFNIDRIQTGYSRFDVLDDAAKIILNDEIVSAINLPLSNVTEYNNWYKKNDKQYYFKEIDSLVVLLNELLGEDLSVWMELPTVHYDIVTDREYRIIGLLSENVKRKNKTYVDSRKLDRGSVDRIRNIFMGDEIHYDPQFKRDLTYYVIRNFYSVLQDRYSNSEVILNGDSFEIPPLMDYASSYNDHLVGVYYDPLISFEFTEKEINYLRENNEFFLEALTRVFEYSYRDALLRIEKKHNIVIPAVVKQYYMQFEEWRKQVLIDMGLTPSYSYK